MRSHRFFGFVFVTLVLLSLAAAAPAQVAVGVAVHFGPPAIPVYVQPLCPGEGYIWVPGYWAWDADFDDYYWVPGTWILPPTVGFLWTPGYWAYNGAGFVFTDGYWGPLVGFYGGINYGFGYFGAGYVGGRWDHDHFYYNRAVNNVNVTVVHNVYNETVVNNYTNRVSYNGGPGGVQARPTAQQEAAARERHDPPVAAQVQHRQAARGDQQLRASVNQGKPPIAATDKPGTLRGGNVVAAQQAGAPYHPPAERAGNRGNPNATGAGTVPPNPPTHAKDIQPHTMPAPDTGNARQDQQYQKDQQKLEAQQQKEHQQMEQQQEKEHQQAARQQANQAQMQQMEQRHQQQTQQMEARHNQQDQQMQQRQAPSVAHNPPRPQQPPPK